MASGEYNNKSKVHCPIIQGATSLTHAHNSSFRKAVGAA